MALTFLLGGARSGKSALAVRMASAFAGPVVVIVTAEARDEEMEERIRFHRSLRPSHWATVEAHVRLAEGVDALPPEAFAVLDCLSLWVANAMEAGAGDDAIVAEAHALSLTLEARDAPAVVVSNEVGLGIVPVNDLARRYRDVLGRVNAVAAAASARSFFIVAGRALPLQDVGPA